jgi:DNA-binding transcriptional MocR family regulator
METNWRPELNSGAGTLHQRLIAALSGDVASGALAPGARMPTHRELARQLEIGIGTVSKFYAEAERLGLLNSHVGRGTYIAGQIATEPEASDRPIDLTLNLPPPEIPAARIAAAITRLHQRADVAEMLQIAPQPGLDRHRQAGAIWLRRWANLPQVDWRRLLVTAGAQHGMFLALNALCRRGDTVLTDAVTFHGATAIAEQGGFTLTGLPLDSEGMRPDALEDAAIRTGARVVYVQPTLQNPTARTMSPARRDEIVRVARRHELWLVECDVYSPLARASSSLSEIVPFAALVPERTIYAGSVSKSLGSGLRVGYLIAPNDAIFDRLVLGMRASIYSSGPLGPEIATQWISNGEADEILRAVADEAIARSSMALAQLAVAERPSASASLHVWLPMSELASERTAGRLLRQGVVVTPPASFTLNGELASGLRLCLGAALNRPTLDRALSIVAATLATETEPLSSAVI